MGMRKAIGLAVVMLWSGGALAQNPSRQAPAQAAVPPSPARNAAECVQRGIAWYKEIGSYPRLTAPPNRGRDAMDVAIERCGRTIGAFNFN